MKRVVISCGPIPSRLDSVKFITNKFKGGLAFATAKRLQEISGKNISLTIVKWKNTSLPWSETDSAWLNEYNVKVVDVIDVIEYYKWFEENAENNDVFIMAAAVANLMPSNPYENKFPSHLYNVGEKFNIEFEIAPRAIDVIKQKNKKCCLIGYKLYDAETDDELIEIAKHTLKDSKANVIFANRPSNAKEKIALTQDGATIHMNFEEHIEFIYKAIFQEYFTTVNTEQTLEDIVTSNTSKSNAVVTAYNLVKAFEQTINTFGTIGIRVPGIGMMTTSRGHKGKPVLVTEVNIENKTITCLKNQKATLNAPTLWKLLEDNPKSDYVIHRHFDNLPKDFITDKSIVCERDYEFPGTLQEVKAIAFQPRNYVKINHHGYLILGEFEDINWTADYYSNYPDKYFNTRDEIEEVIREAIISGNDSLEVGGNTECRLKQNLDPYCKTPGSNVIDYDELQNNKYKYIVARNSINYLTVEQIQRVKDSLEEGGIFIANGFYKAPDTVKISLDESKNNVEVAIVQGDKIYHYLITTDRIIKHSFYARGAKEYEQLGFEVNQVDTKSIIIRFNK